MLRIKVPLTAEEWDEEHEVFIDPIYLTLDLEHSLVSLSKWESNWCKTFLSKKEKTDEEVLDYIRCMTLTQDVPPEAYNLLTRENFEQIDNYVNAPMSSVYFEKNGDGKSSREAITSEVIYNWMISLGIPFECQDWHLNRLISQIHVTSMKNQAPKKMTPSEIASRNRQLNEERKQKWNTKG